MTWHRYERDGAVVQSVVALSPEEVDAHFEDLRATLARRAALPPPPERSAAELENIRERFGASELHLERSR